MITNKKILLIVGSLLGLLSLVIIINVTYNFYNFGQKNAIKKAHSIAESVRDGLTSHMINNTMDNRFIFLDNMMRHQDVENLRTLRAKNVITQFGKGNVDIYEYDDIEKKVMNTTQSITKPYTLHNKRMMRVSIPYVATKYSNPNCLTCHTNVNEGDVLGVISMDLNIEDVYDESMRIIFYIIVMSVIFLIISIFIANHYIKPYIKLFDDLEEGISKAYRGDFSHYVATNLSNEAGEVANRLNELSEIFRFKKTIELDQDKHTIYKRLGHILRDSFSINRFVMMEVNNKEKKREVIYESDNEFDAGVYGQDAMECRAFRTSESVISSDFHNICETCTKKYPFICVPFVLGDEHDLILHIQASSEENLQEIYNNIPIIQNYFDLAKPVLETKMLLDILHNSTMQDPMTGLHNRRFLDQFVEMIIRDTTKEFSILMIDIDFFKQVNDTYGHDVGDKVIKTLAEVLTNTIKGSDIAIRFGGEEFLVFLFDANEENSTRIAESIRHEFARQYFEADSESFNKTLSVGISHYPNQGKDFWKVLKYADMALYEAKESGRDRVISFDESMLE